MNLNRLPARNLRLTFGLVMAIMVADSIARATPTILSGQALNITATNAILAADVIPNGAETSVWFDWGEFPGNTGKNAHRSG